MKFKEIFKGFNIKILIAEVLIFTSLLFIIGFFINREDPFLINSGINSLTYFIPLLVFTLFYGWVAGFLYLTIFFITAWILYASFPIYFFLWMVLFFLLSSEFHYFWDKTLKEVSEKYQFMEEKIRDIAREMMLLKLSHDHLERQYILKPTSLRQIIYELKEKFFKENLSEKELFVQALTLISQAYGIKSAGVIKYDSIKNVFDLIVKFDENFPFETKDPLIEKAIETGLITHIEKKEDSNYLAVIPITSENFIYLICIKDMEFLNFNLETLQAINLIFYYFILEKQRSSKIKNLIFKFKELPVDFLFELDRLSEIYKRFKIESSIVVFIFSNYKGLENLIELKIRKSSRALDFIEFLNLNDKLYTICLLPFTPLSGSEYFIKRITETLKESLSENFVNFNLFIHTLPISKDPEDLLELILKNK